jgi:glutathione S-transferase
MSELILHHYPSSPFSEKFRLVLGMKGLRWRSVTVPVILPKPDVVALTGGYRRTPFMQIGADVYCDTLLMCRVVDRIAPEPPLVPASVVGIAEIVSQWADTALFWTAVPYTMQPAAAAHLSPGIPPEEMKAFAADRAAMNPSFRRAPIADARAALVAYLARLAAMLADGRKFLLGGSASIADFSAAQSIWFMRRAPPIASLLAPFPGVVAWFERVAAFGHGESIAMASDEAIAVAARARDHAPAAVGPDQPFAAGAEVTVAASDYAHDEIVGAVVGLDDEEIVIARDDARAGRVHVHFPRIGFHVRALRKENA